MKKFFILATLLFLLMFGCTYYGKDQPSLRLPMNVTNIVDLGNGWCTFELNEMKFIYHNMSYPNAEAECITRIE